MSAHRMVLLVSFVVLGASNAALAAGEPKQERLPSGAYDQPHNSAPRAGQQPAVRHGRSSSEQAPAKKATKPEYKSDPVYRDRN
jgi:hypothetical protein